jgi:uncharacterized membrane protein (UPF0127 family)
VPAAPTTSADPADLDTGDVSGFDVASVVVDGEALPMAVAATREQRGQGLREVADLGDLAGMLFVWDEPIRSGFTMAQVPIDLDIVVLDEDGVVLDSISVQPCRQLLCPGYRFGRLAFTHAIESPAGTLGLEPGDVVGLP